MLTIGFTLPPGFQTMGLAAASAFELANVVADESLYGIRLLSPHGAQLVMTEQSRNTKDEVAAETGSADPERMRRAFLRAFGQPPRSCVATRRPSL